MIATAYKRLIQLGKVTGAVSFLVAAPYALVQYNQARDAARVEQTLSLFKMYNAPPFSGYREKFTKALIKNKKRISEASKDEQSFRTLQFQILKEDDVETETLRLFDFFDGVAVCVTAQLCDNDTAIKLFKPRAADIYINFYQYMIDQRGRPASRDFGVGVEAIAKSRLISTTDRN
jgi:hypothetical protein